MASAPVSRLSDIFSCAVSRLALRHLRVRTRWLISKKLPRVRGGGVARTDHTIRQPVVRARLQS